jgi:hypothetical protein
VELTTHPLATLGAAWIVTFGADLVLRRPLSARRRHVRAVLLAGCGIVVASLGVIAIWYATRTTYMDPAEPTIPAVAAVFSAGKPLYPALDAPERYAHIYGPDLFILHAAAMALFGQSIRVSKAVGVTAILVSILLAYRLFRARAGSCAAAIATACCALIFLSFGNVAFWTRPDPLLVFCVMLGLLACRGTGWLRTIVLLGVATGVAVNLKISGPVYLVPVYVLVGARQGLRVIVGAAALAAAIAIAPFLVANISVTHFAQYFALSARNGLVAARLWQNLEWAAFLLIPLAATAYAGGRLSTDGSRGDGVLAGVACSILAVALLAAKPGAGPYHLLPCAPLVAYAVIQYPVQLWQRPWLRSLGAGVVLTAFAVAVPRQATFLRTVMDRDRNAVAMDVRRFADAHPASRIGVGYAGTSYFSFARPEIVFRTHDYLLDAPAIQEHRLSGLDLPESTYRAIAECRMDDWLIPDGGAPFDVPSAYAPAGGMTVFPDAFRQTFLAHYRVTGRTTYFTIWECRRDVRIGSARDVQGFRTPES